MNINLKVWRQEKKERKGGFKTYRLQDVDPNISFLEMLDILNNKLIKRVVTAGNEGQEFVGLGKKQVE